MAAARQLDTEEFARAQRLAREVRSVVAEQIRELVIEADRWTGPGDAKQRIGYVVSAQKRIEEAQGRQEQARVNGLPLQAHVEAERDAVRTLRAMCMEAAAAFAGWAAQIDYEGVRSVEFSSTGATDNLEGDGHGSE